MISERAGQGPMITMGMRRRRRPIIINIIYFCLILNLYWSNVQAYMQFEPVHVPKTAEKASKVIATMKSSYGQFTTSSFNKIARTMEDHNCIVPGCRLMGEVLNIRAYNVTAYDKETFEPMKIGKNKIRQPQFSVDPSGGILLQEEETNLWFMMYQFEKPNPGTVYRVRMRLENDTALASRLSIPVSFSAFGGLWRPRTATLTPDNGMIGTEGFLTDAKTFYDVKCLYDKKEYECLYDIKPDEFYDILDFMRYFIRDPISLYEDGVMSSKPKNAIPGFKPYRYGFPYTINLSTDDDDRVLDNIKKVYAMGRTGANGIAVMQDGINVYISGGKGGLFRFVDSGVGDFMSGDLYAAKIIFKDTNSFGEIKEGTVLELNWIYLGETDYEEIEPYVQSDSTLEFGDIFSYDRATGRSCNKNSYKLVSIDNEYECLSVKDETLAVVFEPERLAAMKGATLEVFKFAEMATRLDSDKFYLAASEITAGFLSIESKVSTAKDLPEASVMPNKCGCVFEVTLDSKFKASQIRAIFCGVDSEGVDEVNSCNTESLANPRAMTFANRFETLLIGEDSSRHENPYIWSWDPETEQVTRIFHSPRDGSVTSLTWFQDVVGGNNYIGVTLAHPYDRYGWLSYFGSFDLTAGERLTFGSVGVPYAKGPKNLPTGFSRVTNGVSELTGGFTELFATGDVFKRAGNKREKITIGEVIDEKFNVVSGYEEGPVQPERLNSGEIHHELGFSSLLDMCGSVYSIAVTNSLPAVGYVIKYLNSKKAGLKVEDVEYIDFSAWKGLWVSGSGQISPWNTHLAGEAFEPDAYDFIGYSCLTGFSSCFKSKASDAFDNSIQFIRYYGMYLEELNNKFEKLSNVFNPYFYGYVYEIKINEKGCVSPLKYLTLGRFSHGAIQVMPDQRTVYMTDWTEGRSVGGGLFKFIAKKPADLSEGTLYAAKFESRIGTLEKFDVSWIELGTATNDELFEKIKDGDMSFTDIFEFTPSTKKCRYDSINVKSNVECVDVKKGQEKWAAFFETRRYAALLGASVELANIKGLVYDPSSASLFVAINRITSRDKIMLQDDIEGSTNDVKMPLAYCGCIYQLPITANANTFEFRKFTCGTDDFGIFGKNLCSVENIANPRDLTTIPGHRQILVVEDSCRLDTNPYQCGHTNNAMWSLDPYNDDEFTRILTVPELSSINSAIWYPNINDASYITVAVNELYDKGFNQLADTKDPKALFGIIGPLKNEAADARRLDIKELDKVCYKDSSGYQCPSNAKSSS